MCFALKSAIYLYLVFSVPSVHCLQGVGSIILTTCFPLNNFYIKQIALIF